MKKTYKFNFFICICIIIIILLLILKLKHKSSITNLNELSQLRICGTGNKGNKGRCGYYQNKDNKLKGISIPEAVWNKKTLPEQQINIAFLNDPPKDFKKTFANCEFLDDGSVIFPKDYVFPEGNVPSDYIGVKFDPLEKIVKDTKNIKESILKIIRERYCPLTGIEIRVIPNDLPSWVIPNHITITFNSGGGSWSALGSKSVEKRPSMNFAWFDVGTVLHEFGHAFGLLHEHQSPYKIPFFTGIDWDKPELYAWAKRTQGWDEAMVNQQILNPLSIFDVRGTWFDSESIMLYFFPAILTKNKKSTRQNRRFSQIDVSYLSSLYTEFDLFPKITPQEFYEKVYGEKMYESKIEICVL
jgi:hypothetical protein